MMYINFRAALTLFTLTWALLHVAEGLAQQQQQQQHPLASAARYQPGHDNDDADAFVGRGPLFTRDRLFPFGVDPQQLYHLTVQEVIDSSKFRDGVVRGGSVVVAAGDAGQEHSFEVLVRVSSATSEDVLDAILVDVDEHALTVRSVTPPPPPRGRPGDDDDERPDVGVTVVVFVKPRTPRFGITNVRTKTLDIRLLGGLSFETSFMNLRSVYGSITSSELSAFTPYQFTVETVYGAISGNWSLGYVASFRSVHGAVDVDLVPKRWSYGPYTPGNLAVTTTSGDIEVRMPFERDKLSLRNGTTQISSASGSIRGRLVHGALTTLRTNFGSINVTMLPHWAFPTYGAVRFNHINTECEYGDTYVDVLAPVVDSYYQIQPLCLARSSHEHGYGAMELRYPREWCGRAVGEVVQDGVVRVSGEDFEVVEESKTRVKVQRPPYGSDLVFSVKRGIAELIFK